jgi:hypothetical protein
MSQDLRVRSLQLWIKKKQAGGVAQVVACLVAPKKKKEKAKQDHPFRTKVERKIEEMNQFGL